MGVNPKIEGKPPKWMVKIMENPIKMDDLGVPLFLETPIWTEALFDTKVPYWWSQRKLMVESWGRCLAFGAFPECVSQNHGAKILVADVQQGLRNIELHHGMATWNGFLNDFPCKTSMSEISDVHQRSRSPVEMTARLWHDQYDGLSVMSEAFHEKVSFFDSNSLDGNLKEESVWIFFFFSKAVTWSNEGPSWVFSHPLIPWVGLTTHLCTWWNAGAWSGRSCFIATRDSFQGCLEIDLRKCNSYII